MPLVWTHAVQRASPGVLSQREIGMAFWAVALLFIGLILLFAEVFIPSGGIISVLMTACLVGGVVLAWGAWGQSQRGYFLIYVGSLILLLGCAIPVALHLWPHTPIGKKIFLAPPTQAEVDPFAAEHERQTALIGRIGQTVTPLNPAGMLLLDGKRVHCQSEGAIIDTGLPVRVISATHNRLIVRRLREEEVRAIEAGEDVQRAKSGNPPIADLFEEAFAPIDEFSPETSGGRSVPGRNETGRDESGLVDNDVPPRDQSPSRDGLRSPDSRSSEPSPLDFDVG